MYLFKWKSYRDTERSSIHSDNSRTGAKLIKPRARSFVWLSPMGAWAPTPPCFPPAINGQPDQKWSNWYIVCTLEIQCHRQSFPTMPQCWLLRRSFMEFRFGAEGSWVGKCEDPAWRSGFCAGVPVQQLHLLPLHTRDTAGDATSAWAPAMPVGETSTESCTPASPSPSCCEHLKGKSAERQSLLSN